MPLIILSTRKCKLYLHSEGVYQTGMQDRLAANRLIFCDYPQTRKKVAYLRVRGQPTLHPYAHVDYSAYQK